MKRKLLLILFALFIIIAPRLWKLTQYPPIIVDEPANIRDVEKILLSPSTRFYDFEWGFGQALLVQYPTVMLIKLGINNAFLAQRLNSIILSILALIPFFFIVKKETNGIIAYSTTLFLSSSYFYMQFSRVGWTNMFIITIGLYALWITTVIVKKSSIWWYVLDGILLGIILYGYRAGEVYIGTIVFFIFVEAIKHKLSFTRLISNILPLLGTTLLISLPWIQQINNHQDQFTLREKVVSVWNNIPYHGFTTPMHILLYQIKTTAQYWLFHIPTVNFDYEAIRYLPLPYPPITIILTPLFWFGILYGLKHIKSSYIWFCILVVGLLFGQIMTINPPNGSRGLILLPVIHIILAYGFFFIWPYINKFKYGISLYSGYTISVILINLFIYAQWMTWIQV